MKGLRHDAAQVGFVYASSETGPEQHRRDRLHLSKTAQQADLDLTKHEARPTPSEKETSLPPRAPQ